MPLFGENTEWTNESFREMHLHLCYLTCIQAKYLQRHLCMGTTQNTLTQKSGGKYNTNIRSGKTILVHSDNL